MKATLQIFEFQAHQVRTLVDETGAPWWVAADVCKSLGIRKHRDAISRLDEDERGSARLDTLGGAQEMATVNESGLYTLILRSDKPTARPFRKWVTSEVLPAIRKTGAYAVDSSPAAPALPSDFKSALRALLETLEEKDALAAKVAEDAPKVAFYSTVAASEDTISMRECGILIGMGRNHLMKKMREHGILTHRNVPKQAFVDRGYFKVVEETWNDAAGKAHIQLVTRVRQRGVEFLRRRYGGQQKPIWLPAPAGREEEFTPVPLDLALK